MDIDAKLGKSLDELIKEEEKNRKSTKGSKGAKNGGTAVKGRPSTGRGRGERRGGANGDRMDVDSPGSGGARALKAQGGVQKVGPWATACEQQVRLYKTCEYATMYELTE